MTTHRDSTPTPRSHTPDLVRALLQRWADLAPPDESRPRLALTWCTLETMRSDDTGVILNRSDRAVDEAATPDGINERVKERSENLEISYAAMHREIARGAGVIAALGLDQGDVVGLQVPRGILWIPLFLGALSRGVTALLLNDAYTPRELEFALNDAGARVAIIPRDTITPLQRLFTRRVDSAPPTLIAAESLDALFSMSSPVLAHAELSGDDLAVLAYTSGTTGRPKGARIRHRDLIGTLEALHTAWAWSPRDTLIHTLPLFHIHGLFVAALGGLWARAHVVLLERFEALTALEAVSRYHATVLMGVPTHHHRYLQIPQALRPDVSSLRLVTSGSAPLSAERFAAFKEAFGVEIVERYGMTEVGIVLSERLTASRRPGSVGFPLPGVRAKICDMGGAELGVDEIGEVHITSKSLFEGYHLLPEATAMSVYEVEGERWMRTGDIGIRDSEGRYWLRGRASEMIISGGLNVYPREVERALFDVTSDLFNDRVDEVLALGVPDPEWGERVEAYITTRDTRPLHRRELDSISTALCEHLASYKRPKRLHYITRLPRNAMGKLQRHRLQPRWREGGCHCRAVRWRAYLPEHFDAERCNCSICAMSGNTHVIIPSAHFELLQGREVLHTYRFNTKIAKHLFCTRCGVKSFYHPRSHPSGVGVTWRCLDAWMTFDVEEVPFNGQEWEAEIGMLSHRVVDDLP